MAKRPPYDCSPCRLHFPYPEAKDRHLRSHVHYPTPTCSECSLSFDSLRILYAHLRSTSHKTTFICNECNASFRFQHHLRHHLLSPSHSNWICKRCDGRFSSPRMLMQHDCTLTSRTDQVAEALPSKVNPPEETSPKAPVPKETGPKPSRRKRKNRKASAPKENPPKASKPKKTNPKTSTPKATTPMVSAPKDLSAGAPLSKEADSTVPAPRIVNFNSFTCFRCGRRFRSKHELFQHVNLIHPTTRCARLPCISPKCNYQFASPAALVAHLENGKCVSGIDRRNVNQLVLEQDSEGMICYRALLEEELLGGGEELLGGEGDREGVDEEPSDDYALTPTSSLDSSRQGSVVNLMLSTPQGNVPIFKPRRRKARKSKTEKKAQTFVCDLCTAPNGVFSSERSLKTHVSSTAHAPKLFHCPRILFEGERTKGAIAEGERSFSTLSALIFHLQTGACWGRQQIFWKTMDVVNAKLRAVGLAEVKPLVRS